MISPTARLSSHERMAQRVFQCGIIIPQQPRQNPPSRSKRDHVRTFPLGLGLWAQSGPAPAELSVKPRSAKGSSVKGSNR
jgi:hypothetical protein